MANSNLPYGEGVSIHRPPIFNGENYVYWKIRMRIFIEAIDIAAWDAIENGPYIPVTKDDDGKREKHWSEWSDDERKRAQYDYRAKNIITSALSIDEFFRISQCKSAKEMWDTLQVTHEGTSDVKRSRKHTLIREYELLRMNNGESISDFQKRFTHLINHLVDLGRKFEEEELNLKVLQCLDRSWKAKVTAIEESKDLTSLTLATLFGKLREHEQKLHIFEENEQQDKKGKGVSLRALKSIKGKEVHEESSSEDSEIENFNLLVKKFRKFLRKKRNSPYKFNKKTNKKEEARKKAYIAWEDNDSSTTSDEFEIEEKKLCLMARADQDTIECLRAKSLLWYLDSGCSRHMAGDPSKLSSLKLKNEGFVTYGDNNKRRILGHGNIGNSSSLTLIENVLLVEGLKHNLLSISQLSDKGFKIEFDNTCCLICDKKTKEIRFIGKRIDNIYMLDLENSIAISNTKCLITKEDNIWLWHRRAADIHMDHLNKLSRKELVIGLPKLKFSKEKLCDACQKGKQVKASFKSKNQISTTRPLQLIHMDLFGPSRTMSLGENYYGLVIVDDYSRFTWVMFLANKNEAFHAFKKFAKLVQNEKNTNITSIRSDHGGEFQNIMFQKFCKEHGINHNLLAPRTPQQNRVVERKNRSLEELERTMLNETKLPKYFWADAINTSLSCVKQSSDPAHSKENTL
uniref:Retrovirus-related Pol polyprotein from transposon TNT 1-94 n=1 Tax=Cajanus cajan TaxID=3821 RepID=A0A151QM31_CAJCA|nr:Retrovirus-related Pol polyprotein from transposon TNT 1-94 [Cajanus cajan]